ncbi:hypothetical protein B0H13DRAFT_2574349, partial [Mycena leptocephala]
SSKDLHTTHPFADANSSDVILRSCDGADFYVHRAILALVSPVFQTMFALPQPESTAPVPTIDVQESSATLDRALRFFYPGTHPLVATLDELHETIEILVSKYDMQCIVPTAKQYLEKFLVSDPLGVYGVAFLQRWDDIGRVAAKEAPLDLKYLTSTAYYNLLHYHFHCGVAAKGTTEGPLWVQNAGNYCWYTCGSCAGQTAVSALDGMPRAVRSWFMQFFTQMGQLMAVSPTIDLRNHSSFFVPIRVAVQCNGACRAQALDSLSSFVTVWEAKIEEEIAKVEWKF